MSKISTKIKDAHCKSLGNHQKYLSRITKTLYYGRLPKTDCLSLPVTEFATEFFSEAQKGRSLERLHLNEAANISRNACVSPCSIVLAMLYLDKLKNINPEYLDRTAPSDLFLVSLMVSCKFLFDDGETDEVFMDEWAASGGISTKDLVQLEKDFLSAIEWEVYINELTFWKKLNGLETSLAKKEGGARGFYTYTEIDTLIRLFDIQSFLNCVTAVSLILAATYTAGLLTIVGSVFLASLIPGTCLHPKRLDISGNNSLPITYNIEKHVDASNVFNEIDHKTDLNSKSIIRNLDAVHVLKTGIILASIKTGRSFCNTTQNDSLETNASEKNAQFISYDWWNIPVMKWLSKTSEFVEDFTVPVFKTNILHHLESSAANSKYIELEDHIHKATKTRIQDQLEMSWHEEWIDTIKKGVTIKNRFIQNYIYHINS